MKKSLSLFLLIAFTSLLMAQKQFFAPEKMVETGVYYYPEAWNPNQWDRDFKKMADMGFEFTHVAEFAWAQLEPKEGKYNFVWLDKVVELAAKYKLKVIMCTPSATPPVWLVRKYPEVLVQMPTGQLAQHGTREHYSWSSKRYQELTSKIVNALSKHYANDPRIWGWQIDNEPSHYGTYDYSAAAQSAFKTWLKKKYKSIKSLNDAWGTAFWSGTYSSFDEIEIPNVSRLFSGVASPTSVVDFKRFSADECADFVSMQYKIIKSNVGKLQFVTSNFMNAHTDVDPWRNKDLDFPCYTVYPVAGYTNGLGDQGFRLGDPWRISYANDFFRPVNGVTGVMELQPGQVNWGSYNPQPYPGAVRAWLWNAFAGDLKFICSYRFRQPLYGGEQFHYGMVGTDGLTISNGGEQYRQFMQEVRDLRKMYRKDAKMPKELAQRKTALLYNVENVWETTVQPQTSLWNQYNHITKYYNVLKTLCCPVDVVGEDRDLNDYPVVVVPAFQMVDKNLVEKWRKYVDRGGHLILSCRTGLTDRDGHFLEASWADAITKLIGGKIVMNDMLGPDKYAKVSFNGTAYQWNVWGDIIEPQGNTETWASYSDQFYAGKPAVIHSKQGRGTVTYIGVDTKDGKFEKEIIKKLYNKVDIAIDEQPEGVMVNWRDGFWIAVNYSSDKVFINIPSKSQIVFGSKELDPAGVAVWR